MHTTSEMTPPPPSDRPRPRQGGSTISRWDLTVEQLGAITAYQRMVRLLSIEQPITISYDPTGFIRSTGKDIEAQACQRLEARRRLTAVDHEVFRNKPRHIRSLFDDVVINDISAEQAGIHFRGSIRGKQIAVRTLVASIADEIDIVLHRRLAA